MREEKWGRRRGLRFYIKNFWHIEFVRNPLEFFYLELHEKLGRFFPRKFSISEKIPMNIPFSSEIRRNIPYSSKIRRKYIRDEFLTNYVLDFRNKAKIN